MDKFGILDIADINGDTLSDSLLICTFATPVTIESDRRRGGGDSLNLRRIASKSPAQRWRLTVTGVEETENARFFLHSLMNDVDTAFFVRPPLPWKVQLHTPGMVRNGSSVVHPGATSTNSPAFGQGSATSASTLGQGSSLIPITLADNSSIYRGDFIRFHGHNKVYLITDIPSTTPASHQMSLVVYPPLIAPVNTAEVIHLGKNATMKMRYDIDRVFGATYISGILSDITNLSLIEDL